MDNSASVLLQTVRHTGSDFRLICMEGYSPSLPSGTLICDEQGVWINKPLCRGEIEVFKEHTLAQYFIK